MRISGARVSPGYLRWAAVGLGLLLLSAAIAVVGRELGLFRIASSVENAGTRVSARVAEGVPCSEQGATETVTFTVDDTERRARFDGCGHAEGELVDILVPPGPASDDLVVSSASVAVGDSEPGAGLAVVLLTTSGVAGAGYAFLLRRGPRDTPLSRSLRLAN